MRLPPPGTPFKVRSDGASAMRGQRKVDPKLETKEPLEQYVPMIESYLSHERETISHPGNPEVSIPQLCTFLDGLILQMPKKLRKGRFEQILAASRSATEVCFAAYVAGIEKTELLTLMLARGQITQSIFDGWHASIQAAAKQHHRDTANIIVEFYHRAFNSELANRPKHRPSGSESRATVQFDDDVIHSMLMKLRKERDTSNGRVVGYTLAEAEAALRSEVRIALEQDQSVMLGDGTAKSNLDTHHKRILRKLRAMHRAADENWN